MKSLCANPLEKNKKQKKQRKKLKPLKLPGLAVVIVHDCQRLLVAGLVNVLAHVGPMKPEGFSVSVTAREELQGHPAKANLWLLQEAFAPRRQLIQLGENQSSFPAEERGRG